MNYRRLTFLPSLLALCLCATLGGCSRPAVDVKDMAAAESPERLFESVAVSLKEEKAASPSPDLRQQLASQNIYQHAVQQLNLYLNLKRDALDQFKLAPVPRDQIERGLLGRLIKLDRQAWVEEVQRGTFTELDVHHLDACFLFRDAAQSLRADLGFEPGRKLNEAEQLQLARQAFERVMRQVDLRPLRPGFDPWPAHEVLRRGTGSAEERSRVFLALVQQLELDAGMISRRVEVLDNNQKQEREIPWAPAVRIGKDLHVFEPTIGMAIPAPSGKGVAALRQIQADPKLLESIAGADYDVKPAQIEKASVLIASDLPALSPRMLWLQARLAEAQNPVVLHADLSAAIKRFQEAGVGAEVKLWTDANGYPAVLLARHLQNTRKDPRWRNNLDVVPKDIMAGWALSLAAELEKQEGAGRDLPARELAEKLRPTKFSQPLFEYFELLFLRLRLEPGGVRDLLVRGKPEQAVERILHFEMQLDRSLDAFRSLENPIPYMRQQWYPSITKAVSQFQEALAMRSAGASAAADVQLAELARRIEGLWIDQQMNLRFLTNEWAAPELRQHLTYFMGLAKMELAVRAELLAERSPSPATEHWAAAAREWDSAANWFLRYQAMVYSRPRSYWSAAVERHLETCREHLAHIRKNRTQVATTP